MGVVGGAPSEPTVDVVIVTYNAGSYIEPCLESIAGSRGVKLGRVIVVDNASTDDTLERVERLRGRLPLHVIRLERNMGFPYAVNIGVRSASSEHVIVMNPDVIVDPLCFANLVKAAERYRDAAVVQPKLLRPDGLIDSAGGLMDVLGHGFHIGMLEPDRGQYDEPREILYAEFACVLVRRSICLELGCLDARYFLYNEDLDYCWRAWLAGYRVLYEPSAVAYHVGQHATRRTPYRTLYFIRRNRLYTLFKNYPLHLAIPATLTLMLLYLAASLAASIRRDAPEARVTLHAIRRFLADARRLALQRRRIARRRSVYELLRKHLIVFKLVGLLHYYHYRLRGR